MIVDLSLDVSLLVLLRQRRCTDFLRKNTYLIYVFSPWFVAYAQPSVRGGKGAWRF